MITKSVNTKFSPSDDKVPDYYVVIESTVSPDENREFEITSEIKTGALDYLRFKSCFQTYGSRNRNTRLWKGPELRVMLDAPYVSELLRKGDLAGEAGHPIGVTAETTIARICTIDPNNICHRILEFMWEGSNKICGIVETIDDGNGPGDKFKRSIYQGMTPSFSLRSLVPQRKNKDGTIDVLGPGRFVTYDRVILPSHEEAYLDEGIPIKQIMKKTEYEKVMESLTDFVTCDSDKVQRVLEGFDPAMDVVGVTTEGFVTVSTPEAKLFVRPELKYRDMIKNTLGKL